MGHRTRPSTEPTPRARDRPISLHARDGVTLRCKLFAPGALQRAKIAPWHNNGEVQRRLRVVLSNYIAIYTTERRRMSPLCRATHHMNSALEPTVSKDRRRPSRESFASSVIFFSVAVGLLSTCLPSRSIAQTPSPLIDGSRQCISIEQYLRPIDATRDLWPS